jgi:hypothetical protein
VDHTILVTLVGQEILRGKHIRGARVTPEDWLHCMVSLLCHDIGYVTGVCRADKDAVRATGIDGSTTELPRGATDAALAPYHVDRGKLFMQERFAGHEILDVELITSCIELTRFPVPMQDDHQDTTGLPGLVRAADLIGQLSDPRYLHKIPALFYEFEEIGINAKLGYQTPLDLRRNYPSFYWSGVFPYIGEGLHHLALTQQGNQIRANLFSNVFQVEHEKAGETRSTGPTI